MSITTQDLVKGLDLTGETSITASELNQLVDVARTAADKGFIIETQDSASDTPVVPDPTHEYTGVTPSWWTRYIWKRRSYEDATRTKWYGWDEFAEADATYLNWVELDRNGIEALETAEAAAADATTALDIATTADAMASSALASAYTAKATADANALAITALQTTVSDLQTRGWSPGDFKATFAETTFSTTEDEGWLELDGSTVVAATFPNLAAVKPSWVSGANLVLPDCRGRCVIAAGTGAGLTNRVLDSTGGSEEVTLTSAQSGLRSHLHSAHVENSATEGDTASYRLDVSDGTLRWIATSGNKIGYTDNVTGADASTPHTNMQPWIALRVLVKT